MARRILHTQSENTREHTAKHNRKVEWVMKKNDQIHCIVGSCRHTFFPWLLSA
jgi:hypothetical protein